MTNANRSSEENESSKRELTSTRHTFRQVENSAWETEAHNVGTLVRRLSEAPRREIKCLVGKLMTLHKKLETDGDRIQLDIEEYAELNQHVMQLTTIIADSVGKRSTSQLTSVSSWLTALRLPLSVHGVVAVRYVEDMEKTTPAEVDRGEMAVARVKARCQGKTQNRKPSLSGQQSEKAFAGQFLAAWRCLPQSAALRLS